MTRGELKRDPRFRYVYSEYGNLNSNDDFEIYGNVIKLNSGKKEIYTLIDENYNVIGVYTSELSLKHHTREEVEEKIAEIYQKYSTAINEEGKTLPAPFDEFSLKEVQELSRRISITPYNRGSAMDMRINGKYVIDAEDNYCSKVCYYLLSYISFLGNYLKQYYKNLFKMKSLDLDYPDVYEYIDSLVKNIGKPFSESNVPSISQIGENIGEREAEFYDFYGCELEAIRKLYALAYNKEVKVNIDRKGLLKILEEPIETLKDRRSDLSRLSYVEVFRLSDLAKPAQEINAQDVKKQ